MPRAMTKRTISRARDAFLLALGATANITRAAKAAKISRETAYQWRAADPDFRKQWETALELGAGALEDVAIDRATKGTLRPVYQGGVKVGTVREYSDGLLSLLLKAHQPEKFRERSDVQLTGDLNIAEGLQQARERARNARA